MVNPEILQTTQCLLWQWGRWCYRIVTQGLDYSNQSLIATLQQNGQIIRSRQLRGQGIPYNPLAEAVNEAIEKLASDKPDGANRPEWANVVRINYTMQEHVYRHRVHLSRLSPRQYCRYLQQGEQWLAQQLNNQG